MSPLTTHDELAPRPRATPDIPSPQCPRCGDFEKVQPEGVDLYVCMYCATTFDWTRPRITSKESTKRRKHERTTRRDSQVPRPDEAPGDSD